MAQHNAAAAAVTTSPAELSSSQSPLVRLYINLAVNQRYDYLYIVFLLLAELVLGYLIILKVPYTEIDWQAYMQEVEGWWVDGELDYLKLRGDTGPLVYPAGFLYLFALLRQATLTTMEVNDGTTVDDGYIANVTDIRTAQYYFLGFYLATQCCVLLIYQMRLSVFRRQKKQATADSTKVSGTTTANLAMAHDIWTWRIVVMGVLCLSKRLHSIYLLRLFNDGPTMMLLYLSIFLFAQSQWTIGCLVFSLAVSLKMNILLFAPGLLLLLLQSSPNLMDTIFVKLGLCCAGPQLLLGAPFLLSYPISYLRKAFELDRVFFYKWTVNWKFLPEDVFLSKPLSLFLLFLHLGTLASAAVLWLDRSKSETGHFFFVTTSAKRRCLSPHYIIYTLLLSNFIGICFARTLHYQFYSWYFHSIPYLWWSSPNFAESPLRWIPLPSLVVGLLVLMGMEAAFLTYPATPISSGILQVCHWLVLINALLLEPPPRLFEKEQCEPTEGRKTKAE